MNCKFCDAPLEEDNAVCPACGVDNAGVEDELPEGGEIAADAADQLPETDETQPDADLYDDEAIYAAAQQSQSSDEAPQPDAPQPKKGGKGLLIVLGLVALAAVAALVLAFTGVLGGKDGADPTDVNMVDKDGAFIAHDFSKSEMTAEEASAVVATAGKQKLTNADLSYYYWQQYYGLFNSMGMYISMYLDPNQSLAGQMYDETHSWQDKVLQASMTAFRQNVALNKAAEKAGFTLSQEYTDYIGSMSESLLSEAEANGFDSVDALLQSVYGPYATMDTYLSYVRETMTGSMYLQEQFQTLSSTDEEIVKYFEENPTLFEGMSKDDPNMVAVRHILIRPVADEGAAVDETGAAVLTDENWAAAEQQANEIYAQWQAGEATEASFSALAAEHSTDSSAQSGGLIENVRPGQMVQEFNDWCFDAARKPGDNGIVKTQFGYHIMYFSAVGEHPYWFSQSETALLQSKQEAIVTELVEKVKLKTDFSKVVLVDVNAAANDAAADGAATDAPTEDTAADAAQ